MGVHSDDKEDYSPLQPDRVALMNQTQIKVKPWDRKENGLIVPRCYSIRCGVPKCEQAYISNRAFGVMRPMAQHYREKHPQRNFELKRGFW